MDEQYKQKGLQILGFPCSQFGSQEFKESEKIIEFIKKYNVHFDMFQKIDVNGAHTHPVYQYLKYHATEFNSDASKASDEAEGKKGCCDSPKCSEPTTEKNLSAIGWNFGKFLVNGDGRVIKYGGPKVKPFDFRQDIEKLLENDGKQ
eukprot:GHVS01081048.1.p1 GENE.GHVS01081048.1~~GHVS01081048.1.p1  ORF type:complete len:147 (+),score=25.21 GHVS01081048.1:503-943(+)